MYTSGVALGKLRLVYVALSGGILTLPVYFAISSLANHMSVPELMWVALTYELDLESRIKK